MSPADICTRLVELQAQRRALIRLEVSIGNRRGAVVRRSLGFRIDLPEGEREAIRKRGDRMVKAMLAGETVADASFGIAGFVQAVEQTFAPIAAQREWTEDQMRAHAERLPVWPWVKSIAGVGALGLAVIVGETGEGGDVGAYRIVSGFWKRHGYAVIEGPDGKRIRQQKRTNAEEARLHGYSPERHAQCWAFLQDVLLRAQWRGAKDDEPGHAVGPYGEVYAVKKLAFLSREKTSIHADRHGRRLMAKEFLKDLYLAWRRLTPGDEFAAGHDECETHVHAASSRRAASPPPKPSRRAPLAISSSIAAGQRDTETQDRGAGGRRVATGRAKPMAGASPATSSIANHTTGELQFTTTSTRRATASTKPKVVTPAASPTRASPPAKPIDAPRDLGEALIRELPTVRPANRASKPKDEPPVGRRRRAIMPTKPNVGTRGGGT